MMEKDWDNYRSWLMSQRVWIKVWFKQQNKWNHHRSFPQSYNNLLFPTLFKIWFNAEYYKLLHLKSITTTWCSFYFVLFFMEKFTSFEDFAKLIVCKKTAKQSKTVLWWKENMQSRNKAMLERIETVRRSSGNKRTIANNNNNINFSWSIFRVVLKWKIALMRDFWVQFGVWFVCRWKSKWFEDYGAN